MKKKNDSIFDIDVDISSNGEIKMIRFPDIRKNELMKEVLMDLVKNEKDREEIESFYKNSNGQNILDLEDNRGVGFSIESELFKKALEKDRFEIID